MSHHSDLRLTCPQQPPLFWDPGGDYTEDDPNSVRRGDLMETRAPDLKQWWDYRRGARNEPFMKVFEWDLSPSEARHMHEKLRVGRDAPEEFKTHTLGRFCNVAVFSFLQRYALPADSRAQAHGLARHAGPAPMEAGSRPRVRLSRWPAVEGVRTREDGEEVRRLPATRYPLPVTRYPLPVFMPQWIFTTCVGVAGLIAVVWLVRLAAIRLALRCRQVLSEHSYDSAPIPAPSLCVIVAARDEQEHIENCARSARPELPELRNRRRGRSQPG
jgi:hypothetical protein